MSAWLQFMAGAAFMAGLAGGLHCAAMCGSLIGIATLNARKEGGTFRWGLALSYNVGRITSYALAGAIAGSVGNAGLLRGAPWVHHLLLGIAAGTMALISLYLMGFSRAVQGLEGAGVIVWRAIQPYSRHFLPADTLPRALGLGAVWGWLPCGMVYAVLLAAIASADPIEGGIIMLAFGLGTLPNVIGVMLLYQRLTGRLKHPVVRYTSAAVVALFAVLILAYGAVPAAFTGDSLFCRLVPSLAPGHLSQP